MNIVNHKKTILIIIVVLLAFFGYWYVFISKKDTSVKDGNLSVNKNLKSSNPKSSTTQYDKDFVSTLAGLKPVNLDVSFFETKAYKALSYPETPFVINYPKDSGRINPFLPIGVDISSVNNSAQTQNKTNVTLENPTQLNSTSTATTTIIKTPPKPTPKTF